MFKDITTDPYSKEKTEELKNEEINILQQCSETDTELNMFESETLQDLIAFKWDAYGYKFHLFGCTIHFLYIIMLFIYTDIVYIKGGNALMDKAAAKNGGRLLGQLEHEGYQKEYSLNLGSLNDSRFLKASGGGGGGSGAADSKT